jgi:hypothetical protein
MELANIPGWKALVTDWSALVRKNPEGFSDEELARLAYRHAGFVEDTGGGIQVAFVRFQSVKATATVTDELIALWVGEEPYVEMPTEEIRAEDVD